MILLVGSYYESDKDREEEFLFCLKKNFKSEIFDNIHVLFDVSKGKCGKVLEFIKENNIYVKFINERHKYFDFFEHSKTVDDEIIVIANSDIYFDETIYLVKKLNMNNKFIVLSRWNDIRNGTIKFWPVDCDHSGTADTWIFKNPIKDMESNILLGAHFCDGRIAYEAKQVGYKVINPCYSIKTYHVHNLGTVNSMNGDHRYGDFPWEDNIYFEKIDKYIKEG